jgi:hypothetical protein
LNPHWIINYEPTCLAAFSGPLGKRFFSHFKTDDLPVRWMMSLKGGSHGWATKANYNPCKDALKIGGQTRTKRGRLAETITRYPPL